MIFLLIRDLEYLEHRSRISFANTYPYNEHTKQTKTFACELCSGTSRVRTRGRTEREDASVRVIYVQRPTLSAPPSLFLSLDHPRLTLAHHAMLVCVFLHVIAISSFFIEVYQQNHTCNYLADKTFSIFCFSCYYS